VLRTNRVSPPPSYTNHFAAELIKDGDTSPFHTNCLKAVLMMRIVTYHHLVVVLIIKSDITSTHSNHTTEILMMMKM
jgi:hypothetical protein